MEEKFIELIGKLQVILLFLSFLFFRLMFVKREGYLAVPIKDAFLGLFMGCFCGALILALIRIWM